MKAIKWIIGTLVAVALLAAIAVAYLVFAIDPNSYKPQLAALAKEQDINLNIDGELSWQLLPSLALSIGATQITSPRAEIPAIRFEQADLSLAWLPLFKRQLSVKAIRLEGADIRLDTAQQASNTAIAPLAAAKTDDPLAKPDTAAAPPAFTLAIESLEIKHSRLQLAPAVEGASPQQLSDINLLIQGLNLNGDTFKLKANFTLSDPALPEPMAVALNTEASVEQNTQTLTLSKTLLQLLLADKPAIEISVDALSAGQADAPQLEISGLQINSAGASLQASLSAHTVNGNMAFESEINVPPLALREVLSRWHIELPDLPDKQALQQASLKLSIKGSGDQLTISRLNLTLDDMNFDGSTELAFGPTRNVVLQLHGNTIDLNRYVSSADDTEGNDAGNDESGSSAGASTAPTLVFAPLVAPLLWVGDGNAALDISLDGLNIDAIAAEKLQLKLTAANNIVHIKQLAAHLFDGDINATATINLQHKVPKVDFTAAISELAAGKALTAISGEAAMTGRLTAKFQGQTRGTDAEQLHQGLKANGEINLAKPYLTTFNIEKSYCDIAALIEKIPSKDDWPQGSNLQDVQATVAFKGKQVFIQRYTTGLGNISLSGNGLIDLGTESFDLLATSRLNGEQTSEQGCRVKSKRVRDKDIPIRCKDSFANAGGGSCKPDGDFVKQVVQDKLFEKIQKKSGLNPEAEEAVKGLLKGLFGN
ncbi:MAG: AsmA family protein [Gammaproteobacteria bacterium]|nr:AsmA family protein [Gammaproteobacteria bacterium]MBQ0840107.1 AsmA family protein [Gammaproteobacteria bacterium]